MKPWQGMKKSLVVILGVGIVVLAALILLGSPTLEFDGCECGRQRQWACFEFACCNRIRLMKFHVIVHSTGDVSHKHVYWDAQYERIGWIEFFRYLRSPNYPVLPTVAH